MARGAQVGKLRTMDSRECVVVCWGSNMSGQCGNGAAEGSGLQPTAICSEGVGEPVAVAAGEEHSALVTRSGELLTWGANAHGQLGHGSVGAAVSVPRVVVGLVSVPVCAVACGSRHTLALSVAGEVYGWGTATSGALGIGDDVPDEQPMPARALTGAPSIAIACGAHHSVALTESGVLLAWGWGRHGQLGDGVIGSHAFTPREVRCVCAQSANGHLRQAISAGALRRPATPCDALRRPATPCDAFSC